MPFQTDPRVSALAGKLWGEYLTSYTSSRGEVRAELFRKGGQVTAYVSFPTGLDGIGVKDPYVTELRTYAREQGFADQFEFVYKA
jgi:hypothetical protein